MKAIGLLFCTTHIYDLPIIVRCATPQLWCLDTVGDEKNHWLGEGT